MAQSPSALRTTRGIQQSLFAPPRALRQVPSYEAKGVVYTKRWVVELLLDLAGYRPECNLVDVQAVEPAAGDGAFLGPMIARLVDSCVRLDRPVLDCANSLIAYELDDDSAGRARTLALGILSERGVERPLAERLVAGWVRTGDYLFQAMSLDADFVIGNPPYVRLEDIPEETASIYRQAYPTMCGRADLYVAFFEAALHQLKNGGTCAFICADRWMRNQYGGELRKLVTSAYAVDVVIEMHTANAFQDEVDAYPAITVIRGEDSVRRSWRAPGRKQGRSRSASSRPPCGQRRVEKPRPCRLAYARRLSTPGSKAPPPGPVTRQINSRSFAAWKSAFPRWS
jgi:hypothetical protein